MSEEMSEKQVMVLKCPLCHAGPFYAIHWNWHMESHDKSDLIDEILKLLIEKSGLKKEE
jgi:hypothetical protein